nr:MAG TPA: hypothetical protein [Caudoviricetes sp.]
MHVTHFFRKVATAVALTVAAVSYLTPKGHT